IEARGDDAAFTEDGETWTPISGDTTVSLNLWVFKNSIFDEMQARFANFLNNEIASNPLKKEYYLPSVSNQLLSEKKASFKVLPTKARWFGMTYLEDLPNTKANIAKMKENGEYPENLW
ncbi:MAG: nucleotidyltransferase, partial [Clostridia bacterium]|nr:nucleotidyltransferase [Clostridia bacterium]